MPQTVEHLDIVSLLGVSTGVVALNKADLADEARLEQVEAGIRDLVADTPLQDAPVVRVSATTGQGLPALRSALDQAVARVVARRRTSFFRVPIDRIFSIPGRGTVVTGSMLGGTVQVGDRVTLLPGGQEFRVRGLQTHNPRHRRAGGRATHGRQPGRPQEGRGQPGHGAGRPRLPHSEPTTWTWPCAAWPRPAPA